MEASPAKTRDQSLGAFGIVGTLSSRGTWCVGSDEGALLNDHPALAKRAKTVRKKGADSSNFLNRPIDRYTFPNWSATAGAASLQTCDHVNDSFGQLPRAN